MKMNKIDEVWNSANLLFKWICGLLSSKHFATMATWRNDVSSVLHISHSNVIRAPQYWEKKVFKLLLQLSNVQFMSSSAYQDVSSDTQKNFLSSIYWYS